VNHIIYHLEEFQPWPEQSCYIWGTAVITYNWERPEPDVGYRGGPTDIRLQSLVISGDKEPLIIPYGTQLFEAVARAAAASDHVAAECGKDHESWAG